MKPCPSCGESAMHHSQGRWVCVVCGFEHEHQIGMPTSKARRQQRRYKRVLGRLDKIGVRLASIKLF